jgi:hypothetical protein
LVLELTAAARTSRPQSGQTLHDYAVIARGAQQADPSVPLGGALGIECGQFALAQQKQQYGSADYCDLDQYARRAAASCKPLGPLFGAQTRDPLRPGPHASE